MRVIEDKNEGALMLRRTGEDALEQLLPCRDGWGVVPNGCVRERVTELQRERRALCGVRQGRTSIEHRSVVSGRSTDDRGLPDAREAGDVHDLR
jgi:hypothetical protein